MLTRKWGNAARRLGWFDLRSRVWWVTGGYALFATLWILLSDRVIGALYPDPELLVKWSVYKGLGFVAVTSGLLFFLMWGAFGQLEASYRTLQRHQSEIERLQRLYAALSQISQAIVWTSDRRDLSQRICDVLVRFGGFETAWIGEVDGDRSNLIPLAKAGNGGVDLDPIPFPDGDDDQTEPYLVGVIRASTGIYNDLTEHPGRRFAPAREGNPETGAYGCFPIRLSGELEATLNVYASEPGTFQDGEIGLLEQAADDISFALENLDRERQRREAEDALRESEIALRSMNENLEEKVARRTAELESALERAESADRLKSAFLATVSHELRTPLNSIIGFTGILHKELPGPLNEEQHKQLGMVQGSARHLLALINDVLDLSKIEADQLEIRAETFDPRESAERVAASVKPFADQKGIDLTTRMPEEIREMTTDRRRLEQILLNLLNNAVKFTEKGGVTLAVERGRKHEGASDEMLRFVVEDTGIGIPRKKRDHLFRPFCQIENALEREHEGTGLGLAICLRLAVLLGGEIDVESEPRKGSVFTVTLPRNFRPES